MKSNRKQRSPFFLPISSESPEVIALHYWAFLVSATNRCYFIFIVTVDVSLSFYISSADCIFDEEIQINMNVKFSETGFLASILVSTVENICQICVTN